jgi:hypothetical protein
MNELGIDTLYKRSLRENFTKETFIYLLVVNIVG